MMRCAGTIAVSSSHRPADTRPLPSALRCDEGVMGA